MKKISDFFSENFNGKVRKIALNAGLGCPGRCIYCNNAAFNPAYANRIPGNITEQLRKGIEFAGSKARDSIYLGYFQSYTNTFGETPALVSLYEEALSYPGVGGLVIATRPDCISDSLMDWLESRFGRKAPSDHPFLLMEIGVESTLDRTLEIIGRGHDWECSKRTILELDRRGINVGVHLILGLPGENEADFITHAERISALPVKTLKLHQLQVLEGTPLARIWKENPSFVRLFTPKEYAGVVHKFLDHLSPSIALDRFVSEAPPGLVLAPRWNLKPEEFNRILFG